MLAWKRIFCAAAAAVALAGTAGAQEAEYETRVAEDGFESPPARLADVQWLVGQWRGTGIGDAPAMESWLPPSGGTMVGSFVQEASDGRILFTEHLYLMEEEATLVLRLKHFNADLTGWEEKDGMLTFRLIAVDDCAAYFRSLTLRCDGEDGLLAAVRMKSADGGINELIFRFVRMRGSESEGQFMSAFRNCTGFTREMNQCAAAILRKADERRKQYLDAALARSPEWSRIGIRPVENIDDNIRASAAAFEAYRTAECDGIYARQSGSIRTMESLVCEIELTERRTRTIWKNWLTYHDDRPPILPEPQ